MVLEPDVLAEALARRPILQHPALPGRRNHLRAGVCLPLRFEADRLVALATLRPPTLRTHGGEVSFPGGRPEPHDDDLEATARRETAEEIGLHRLEVLGRLASMPLFTSEYRLEPFVAAVDPAETVRPNPGEVGSVLELDLTAALAADHLPGLAGEHEGAAFVMPSFVLDGWLMFGATALTAHELLGVVAEVLGVEVPEVVPLDVTWDDIVAHGAAVTRPDHRAR